ncbi:Protein CBG11397 [Caenorhabditis briggsae]|uniref:Protein CBG11397 n=1 Tax=Caenorhabditis briggsae TaxID=6238 RepID=A8XD43_CAEBR|nr:Protein CBG11397 [Caenorhabditis briggsae]CAP30562.2 Protein CBG11397 [Caenorhabditis briggsae]
MKLYFGLGMSMNKAFLDELRTEAVVDVDQFTRMIRFFQIDKYRLFQEDVAPNLHLADIEIQTKAKLYFALSLPVNHEQIKLLRKDGIVTFNSKGCIAGYSERNVKNETLIDVNNNPEYTMSDVEAMDVVPGKRARYNSAPPQLSLPPTQEGVLAETIEDQNELTNQLNIIMKKAFSSEEDLSMWQFLLCEIVNPMNGRIERDRVRGKGLTIWEKYRQEVSDARTATSLRKRYSTPTFPSPQYMGFDIQSQAKLHYALSIPVSDAQMDQFREHADVDLDDHGCIIRYIDRRPGGLELRPLVKRRIRITESVPEPELKHPNFDLSSLVNGGVKEEQIDDSYGDRDPIFEEEGQSSRAPIHGDIPSALLRALNQFLGSRNAQPPVEAKQEADRPSNVETVTYLRSLNTLVAKIDSPELESVQLKLEKAIEESKEGNYKIPISKVKMMMEATLAMMGF